MEKLNKAILEIQTDLDIFAKKNGKNNIGKGYKYFTETDLYNALKPKMKAVGISYTIEKKGNVLLEQKGNMWLYASDGILRLAKEDEVLELEIFLTSMNTDPAKALGSALTYATRYWLCKIFGIATDELDPDNDENSKEVENNKKEINKKPEQKDNYELLIETIFRNKWDYFKLKDIIIKDLNGLEPTKANIKTMIKDLNKTEEYIKILKGEN